MKKQVVHVLEEYGPCIFEKVSNMFFTMNYR